MRFFIRLSAVLTLLASGSSALAQQAIVPAARDPLAINLLVQSLTAAGGPAVSAIQDFTGTGNITYNWAGVAVSGSVKVYGKGLEEFRMESSMPAGNQILVVNGNEAILTPVYDTHAVSPMHATMTAGSPTFPAIRIAQVLSDSSISASYMGSVTWNGVQAYQVHIVLLMDPRLRLGSHFSGLGECDLYFDPNSYQLLGLAERVWWDNDPRQSYLHELFFSEYRPANGTLAPFTITEKMGGQQTWSMTLSSLTFNSGLSDTLFELLVSENPPEG